MEQSRQLSTETGQLHPVLRPSRALRLRARKLPKPRNSERELLNRVTARQDVFRGKPVIRDMRISVELILNLLAQGVMQGYISDHFPELDP